MPLLLPATDATRSPTATFLRRSDPNGAVSTSWALTLANARYWTTVAPVLRRELRRWQAQADAIEDPQLRALALDKLRDESFHAHAAGMTATIAPRKHRRGVVQAIVALEVLFDYLDGLSERPDARGLRLGERLYQAFAAPFGTAANANAGSDHYSEQLSAAVTAAFANLPAASVVAPVAHRIARRLGQAQTRMHAAGELGIDELERWAAIQARVTDLDWRELLAGAASSVLVLHTLIAAAADPRTTDTDAVDIEGAYLPMSTLLTLLDGLVDHDRDAHADSELGYIDLYHNHDELCTALIAAADHARARLTYLRSRPHHTMMLTAVVAYYTTAPGGQSSFARGPCERLENHLQPATGPALLVMRAWRAARRLTDRTPPRTGEPT